MRRPGFLSFVETPGTALHGVLDPGFLQAITAEQLAAIVKLREKSLGPRVIHDCPGGTRYVEGRCQSLRDPKQEREMWLNTVLARVLYISDRTDPRRAPPIPITRAEKEMLLSNYDTLAPAMRNYLKWMGQVISGQVSIQSVPLCSKKYTAHIQAKENLTSARNRLIQAKATGEQKHIAELEEALKRASSARKRLQLKNALQRIKSKEGSYLYNAGPAQAVLQEEDFKAQRLSSSTNMALQKCLVISNPSPIHKMLGRGSGPDRKVIPTEYLIGVAILAAILLLRKRSI